MESYGDSKLKSICARASRFMVSNSWTAGVEFFLFYPERTGGFGLELSSFKLENVQPVCHMRHRRVLAVFFFSSRGSLSCTSELRFAAGAANEGSRKTGC